MPGSVWSIEYDVLLDASGDALRVRNGTRRGAVVDFVVQYEIVVDDQTCPVVRYDGSHGHGHRDLLDAMDESIKQMSARVNEHSVIDEAVAAQVTRNIELAFQFTASMFANPSLADGMPRGAAVVLIPDDDPDLAEANLATAIKAFHAGRDVSLRHASSASVNRAGDDR